MLRTKVIDLVNSGEAWAFLGSGVSADAGGPTWRELLDSAVEQLGASELVGSDDLYQTSLTSRDLARCFGRLEHLTNRNDLDEAVCSYLGELSNYGDLHAQLAEWPFRGYMTTNYDVLLEKAMRGSGQHGWIPVGNTDSEIRKLSGSPSNVVWHVHGFLASADERAKKSKLILTDSDYDELYLEGSRTVNQLRGLLSLSQIVFIGFGFSDPEFERVLKLVGRLTSPERPLYAFFPFRSGEFSTQVREEYLFRFNIDLIPYEVLNRPGYSGEYFS